MNYAVILSGGTGSRMGLNIPKQYCEVAGKPIIQYVIETMSECEFIAGYVIVAAKEWQEFIKKAIDAAVTAEKTNDATDVSRKTIDKADSAGRQTQFLGFAEPGGNRQMSIYHGLLALKRIAKEDDVVLIQDAARPNTTVELMRKCVEIPSDADGVMPVLPMKDTIYLSHTGETVDSLLRREELFAGQAPEAFRYGKYLRANEALLPERILQVNGSTEAAVLAGMNIAMIDGEEENFKITTMGDLERFRSSHD